MNIDLKIVKVNHSTELWLHCSTFSSFHCIFSVTYKCCTCNVRKDWQQCVQANVNNISNIELHTENTRLLHKYICFSYFRFYNSFPSHIFHFLKARSMTDDIQCVFKIFYLVISRSYRNEWFIELLLKYFTETWTEDIWKHQYHASYISCNEEKHEYFNIVLRRLFVKSINGRSCQSVCSLLHQSLPCYMCIR